MDNDSIEVLRNGIRQYNAIINALSNRILKLESENSRLRSLLTDRRECVDQVSIEIRDILAAYATPQCCGPYNALLPHKQRQDPSLRCFTCSSTCVLFLTMR